MTKPSPSTATVLAFLRAASVCAALAAPWSAIEARAADAAVRIDNFTFSPQQLTVAPGTTVTWTNADDIPHTVTANDRRTFKSKPLDTDDRFSFTFRQPGEYSYFCALHPHMTGKILVKAP
jgi:plastocyanin